MGVGALRSAAVAYAGVVSLASYLVYVLDQRRRFRKAPSQFNFSTAAPNTSDVADEHDAQDGPSQCVQCHPLSQIHIRQIDVANEAFSIVPARQRFDVRCRRRGGHSGTDQLKVSFAARRRAGTAPSSQCAPPVARRVLSRWISAASLYLELHSERNYRVRLMAGQFKRWGAMREGVTWSKAKSRRP